MHVDHGALDIDDLGLEPLVHGVADVDPLSQFESAELAVETLRVRDQGRDVFPC